MADLRCHITINHGPSWQSKVWKHSLGENVHSCIYWYGFSPSWFANGHNLNGISTMNFGCCHYLSSPDTVRQHHLLTLILTPELRPGWNRELWIIKWLTISCHPSPAGGAGWPVPWQRAALQGGDQLGSGGVFRASVGPEAGIRHQRVRPASHEPPVLRSLRCHWEKQETQRYQKEEQEGGRWLKSKTTSDASGYDFVKKHKQICFLCGGEGGVYFAAASGCTRVFKAVVNYSATLLSAHHRPWQIF